MSAPVVARLSDPGEILAVLPSLCGFPPTESLVLLSLRGARKRVGLTARVDLPPGPDERPLAALCADRLRDDGARSVVVAVFSEHGRRSDLVGHVRAACAARHLAVLEALHVQDGRWSSYTCDGPCCPSTGTPLPVAAPVLGLIAAEQAAAGQVLLSSREELVRSLAPPRGCAADAADRRLAEASVAWSRHRLEHGVAASRRSTLEHARALLDRVADGGAVSTVDADLLAVGLADVQARDGLAAVMLHRSDELLSLLQQVAVQVTPPHDVPVCTLLAWVAYGRGNGALANVALDRALAGPDYPLARLLRQCLDGGIAPEQVREIAADAAAAATGRAGPGGGRSGALAASRGTRRRRGRR